MSLAITATFNSQSNPEILQSLDSNADGQSLLSATDETKTSGTELRDAFQEFVGKTFYGQLLKSMRKTVGKPAYFHGGRGEEVFRSQLDQLVVERITETSAAPLADSLYDLSALSRRR
ncbi:MAG: rod-binding protein [Pirellulales bacterium]|nr:rod-binding protein [Pirellulales bacterium]